jgi:hypothetical protein
VPNFNSSELGRPHFFIGPAFLLICSFYIVSCQSIIKKETCNDSPGSISDAVEFVSNITSKGASDITIKGIGKITLWDSDGIMTSRAAWAGAADGRLRIEMLGLPGHPVAKFIYNGHDYLFISPLDQQTYLKRGADADLDLMTGLPVPSADIIRLLSGVIPVYAHDVAMFQTGEPQCRDVLVLKQKWRGVVEKLFLNNTHDRVVKIEIFRWGGIEYSVEIGDFQTVDGREVPFHLMFSDGDQKGFSIEVERCWPDINITPEMFLIESE